MFRFYVNLLFFLLYFHLVFHISVIQVERRLHAKNLLPTFVISGESYEEDLQFGFLKTALRYYNLSSIIFLLGLKAGSMPKFSFLPLLFFEIAMKKTFDLDFGKGPQYIIIVSSIYLLFWLKSWSMPKISFLPFLFLEIAMMKTFNKIIRYSHFVYP